MDRLEQLLAQAHARRTLPTPEVRRQLRERAGLSQSDVAGVLGVTRPTVTRWESGTRSPYSKAAEYAELLKRLAAVA